MNVKKWQIIIGIIIVFGGIFFITQKKKPQETVRIVNAQIGSISQMISTTGTALPKNRLEIKPPVNGRIEEVLVKEGQNIKVSDTLVLMSSSDRAALLDAARGKGEAELKYWQEVYKAIPLVSPIDGQVIVGTIQPGQTVTTADPVIVLSDRLIVRAQVDETDIGKVKQGQKAYVSLDAYPDQRLAALVDHIYYESQIQNNVTIYSVDLVLSDEVPPFFRSGMNANIDFILDTKDNVLTLPQEAVRREKGNNYVLVQGDKQDKPQEVPVTLGISDDKQVEIIDGITEKDDVVIQKSKKLPTQASGATNPFMPMRGGGSGRRS